MHIEEFSERLKPFDTFAFICFCASLAPLIAFLLFAKAVGDKPSILVTPSIVVATISILIGYLAVVSLLLGIVQAVFSRKFSKPYRAATLAWISIYLILAGVQFLFRVENPDAPFYTTLGYVAYPFLPSEIFLLQTTKFFANPTSGSVYSTAFKLAMFSIAAGIVAGYFAYRLQNPESKESLFKRYRAIHTPLITFSHYFNPTTKLGNKVGIGVTFEAPAQFQSGELQQRFAAPVRAAFAEYCSTRDTLPPDPYPVLQRIAKQAVAPTVHELRPWGFRLHIIEATDPAAHRENRTESRPKGDIEFEPDDPV